MHGPLWAWRIVQQLAAASDRHPPAHRGSAAAKSGTGSPWQRGRGGGIRQAGDDALASFGKLAGLGEHRRVVAGRIEFLGGGALILAVEGTQRLAGEQFAQLVGDRLILGGNIARGLRGFCSGSSGRRRRGGGRCRCRRCGTCRRRGCGCRGRRCGGRDRGIGLRRIGGFRCRRGGDIGGLRLGGLCRCAGRRAASVACCRASHRRSHGGFTSADLAASGSAAVVSAGNRRRWGAHWPVRPRDRGVDYEFGSVGRGVSCASAEVADTVGKLAATAIRTRSNPDSCSNSTHYHTPGWNRPGLLERFKSVLVSQSARKAPAIDRLAPARSQRRRYICPLVQPQCGASSLTPKHLISLSGRLPRSTAFVCHRRHGSKGSLMWLSRPRGLWRRSSRAGRRFVELRYRSNGRS